MLSHQLVSRLFCNFSEYCMVPCSLLTFESVLVVSLHMVNEWCVWKSQLNGQVLYTPDVHPPDR